MSWLLNGGSIDMNKVRNLMDKATAVVMQYGEMETKVRQVTNNDPWGSSATDMMDLARHTYNYQDFMEIMGTISKRLNEPVGSTWRQTYKALQLLEFLIINGSEQVIDDAKRRIYDVKGCQNYQYVDDKKKDQGVNIRHRATKIIDLLADDNLIRDERKKAKDNKSKYTGVSSTDMRNGGFGSSSNSNNYSSSGFGNGSTGFGSDSVRRSSGAGGGYSDSAYNSNTNQDSGYRDSSTEQSLPKVEKITELPKPVAPPPAQPVKNLLDFDEEDEFSSFSGVAPPQSSSNAGVGSFANFSSSSAAATTATAPATQFADFGAFQQQPVQAAAKPPETTGFAEFANFAPSVSTANTLSKPNNFAAFGSISPTTAPVNSFANFAPISPSKQTAPITNAAADDFGDFADFTSANSTTTTAPPAVATADPIAKLVSLDAFSLSNTNPKKDSGPSLNSLRLI